MRSIEPLLREQVQRSVDQRDPAIRKAAKGSRATARSRTALSQGVSPLASKWCGHVVGHDRLTNAVMPHSRKQIKVIYAHPGNRPNRMEAMAPYIQHAMKLASEMIILASGGTKGLAVDIGTECGSNFVDIQSITLPVSAESLNTAEARFNSGLSSVTELRKSGAFPMDRNVLVFIDYATASWGGGGMAEMLIDSRPDPAVSWHSLGGRTGVVYIGASPIPATAGYGIASSALHEIMHMLGAVQPNAPNSTTAGHCTDTVDLLCYDDGAGHPMRLICPSNEDNLLLPLDCNGDDYFNPNPPAGSYLATHWNTYNSPFLCHTHECWAHDGNKPLTDPSIDLDIDYTNPVTTTAATTNRAKPKRVTKVKRSRATRKAVRITWAPRPSSERVRRYQIRRYVKGQRPKTVRLKITRRSGRVIATVPRISRTSTARIRAYNTRGWGKLSKTVKIPRRAT